MKDPAIGRWNGRLVSSIYIGLGVQLALQGDVSQPTLSANGHIRCDDVCSLRCAGVTDARGDP